MLFFLFTFFNSSDLTLVKVYQYEKAMQKNNYYLSSRISENYFHLGKCAFFTEMDLKYILKCIEHYMLTSLNRNDTNYVKLYNYFNAKIKINYFLWFLENFQ